LHHHCASWNFGKHPDWKEFNSRRTSRLSGHLTIGENSVIAAQAGVIKSLPAGSKVSGYPAKPHEEAKIVNAHLQRLPHYVEIIHNLQKRVEDLEHKLKKKK